ncbi:MAG TPA: HAMP domain-containing sensor histidine kinase [Chloroflexota bacterium]|nr:HAMP domain-containing sensor histidine kinase [Chloroflexota bacterium]
MNADDHERSGAAETEEFMSVAAHDLRNPLAVMRASAQMAQRQVARGDLDAARGRLVAIVEQTDRLTEMIDTFLDASRLDAGKLPLHQEQVDLADVVEEALLRARRNVPELAEREVRVEVPSRCIGRWDRARIVRAVRALLCNALIYGDANAPVRVWASLNGARVRLRVSGGGVGPDEDERQHLFERFYRGRSAAEAGQAGSGLGLFVSRGIARLHDGEVRRVEADVFEMELPLVQ